ncbi:MAG: permease-like cell division protein FtsX [Bacteroidales bacterium]|nr:permease-like cell division protein FtsX [Bacteroidales bacterium]MCF8403251.1 permease-like cell division protein FtsX [Bacteroidales bacterium]
MAIQEEKYNRRRLKGSYFTTIVSITLVLFMLGLLGLIILHTKKLSDYVKENIGFSIIMKNNVKEAGIIQLQKILDATPYVKSTKYITKEEAAKQFTEELGEDFTNFLGYNPLLPTIEVRFKADYANNDSLLIIKDKILENSNVKEVWYQESLVDVVNKNIRKIGIIILGFSALLLIIATALINNTIRLSVYSKRFIIRSMQLVGATRGFISKPFILKGILQGIIGAIFSIILLSAIIYFSQRELPELINFQDVDLYLILFGIVLVLGILLTWTSNYLAVRKYIKINPDKLYY